MLLKIAFAVLVISSVFCDEEKLRRCARQTASCLLAPQSTEGPYYWNSTVRQDITEGKAGVPFSLAVTVLDITTCSPLSNVVVDLWHCDGTGLYSHYIAASQGQSGRLDNTTFFRGQQVTDTQGVAVFKTIYPGWYRGRATHMHVKVHVGATLQNIGQAIYTQGGHVSYTGQLFFDDALTDEVARVAPYVSHTIRRTRNSEDGIYSQAKGSTTLVPIQFLTSNRFQGAVAGKMTLGVNPRTSTSSNGGRPRPPGR